MEEGERGPGRQYELVDVLHIVGQLAVEHELLKLTARLDDRVVEDVLRLRAGEDKRGEKRANVGIEDGRLEGAAVEEGETASNVLLHEERIHFLEFLVALGGLRGLAQGLGTHAAREGIDGGIVELVALAVRLVELRDG